MPHTVQLDKNLFSKYKTNSNPPFKEIRKDGFLLGKIKYSKIREFNL